MNVSKTNDLIPTVHQLDHWTQEWFSRFPIFPNIFQWKPYYSYFRWRWGSRPNIPGIICSIDRPYLPCIRWSYLSLNTLSKCTHITYYMILNVVWPRLRKHFRNIRKYAFDHDILYYYEVDAAHLVGKVNIVEYLSRLVYFGYVKPQTSKTLDSKISYLRYQNMHYHSFMKWDLKLLMTCIIRPTPMVGDRTILVILCLWQFLDVGKLNGLVETPNG